MSQSVTYGRCLNCGDDGHYRTGCPVRHPASEPGAARYTIDGYPVRWQHEQQQRDRGWQPPDDDHYELIGYGKRIQLARERLARRTPRL